MLAVLLRYAQRLSGLEERVFGAKTVRLCYSLGEVSNRLSGGEELLGDAEQGIALFHRVFVHARGGGSGRRGFWRTRWRSGWRSGWRTG
jgi:hypothetical protein